MKNNLKPRKFLVILLFIFALSLLIIYDEFGPRQKARISYASAGDNVSGFAWNEKIGWISFNSTDCDKNNNGYVDTNAITNGCNGNDNPTTRVKDYGAKVDQTTGHLSGYAWSNGLGWILLNATSTPDYSFNANCRTAGSCTEANNCSACYNINDQKVYGWAKIIKLGADGWLRFDGTWTNSTTINPTTGEFGGFAWNGNDSGDPGIGWISFNCSNETPACGGSNYKVMAQVNLQGAVANLRAPLWNYTQASAEVLHANLQFDYLDSDLGSFGSAYRIIITQADDTPVLDTGKCTGFNTPTANCKIDNSICLKNIVVNGCVGFGDCTCVFPLAAELDYATAYKWSVTVWDNYDVASNLVNYDTDPDTDNDDNSVPTFTTYLHEFPRPGADWFPDLPSQGEQVFFSGTSSQRYSSLAPDTAVLCQTGTCSWQWSVAGGTATPANASTTIIVFDNDGTNFVTLTVTDIGDTGDVPYYTSVSFPVDVNRPLPEWQEIKAD